MLACNSSQFCSFLSLSMGHLLNGQLAELPAILDNFTGIAKRLYKAGGWGEWVGGEPLEENPLSKLNTAKQHQMVPIPVATPITLL